MGVEPSGQQDYALQLLQGTESVLVAARRLRTALDEDAQRREFATSRLELAAELQEGTSDQYQAFMFEEIERAPGHSRERELLSGDALALVLADVEVGNVLIAAGQALGEASAVTGPEPLDEALVRLRNTRNALERAQAAPFAEAGGLHYGFGSAPGEEAEVLHSTDLPAAIAAFRGRSESTLALVVEESVGVLSKTIEALSKLSDVGEALAKLGGPLGQLPKIGRLVGLGLRKLRRAIASLAKLLGDDAVKKVKSQVEALWKKATGGEVLTTTLRRVFEVERTRASIEEILGSDQLEIDRLDKGSADLDRLSASCRGTMGIMGGILGATTFVAPILALTPVAGTTLMLAVATVDLLVIAAILLIGMDYADSGRVIERVRGVGEIARGLVVVRT